MEFVIILLTFGLDIIFPILGIVGYFAPAYWLLNISFLFIIGSTFFKHLSPFTVIIHIISCIIGIAAAVILKLPIFNAIKLIVCFEWLLLNVICDIMIFLDNNKNNATSDTCNSNDDEYVTFHILSLSKGYIQDVIKVTPENRELLNKELDKKTNGIYCYELSENDTPRYEFITKELFDIMLSSFQENQKQLLFNHTCSHCGKTFKVKYNMPKGQTTIPNLSVICPKCNSKEDIEL